MAGWFWLIGELNSRVDAFPCCFGELRLCFEEDLHLFTERVCCGFSYRGDLGDKKCVIILDINHLYIRTATVRKSKASLLPKSRHLRFGRRCFFWQGIFYTQSMAVWKRRLCSERSDVSLVSEERWAEKTTDFVLLPLGGALGRSYFCAFNVVMLQQ